MKYFLITLLLTSTTAAQAQTAARKPAAMKAAKSGNAVAQHPKTFDELDYDVFSNEKWDRLHGSSGCCKQVKG
ncbi:MAG: hypothetical protein H7Z21_17970 [Hymenobacter sp.]|nr:hypothetical protein [Hymenobacter sp.]